MTLQVSQLRKTYRDNVIFDACSYTFKDSMAYAIVGPNGTGKSTFLRMCALLEKPDAGTIDFLHGDRALDKSDGIMRRITLLLPSVGVFNTSVYENVAYGLRVRKCKNTEIEQRVAALLKLVGLHDKMKRRALTLSSGETQRMGLARALAIAPEILMLDEPTAAVDTANYKAITDILLSVKHSMKTTIIFATHDVKLADNIADRVVTVSDGLLMEI
ncbi:MAG: ATP-binding cassette domain-containing protein [Candidatus Magnetominusculus sp. LBB02]|nr:ATP-binding cassette domain-containing protein [Candidatus Magnetominusculus sp. LBB02]